MRYRQHSGNTAELASDRFHRPMCDGDEYRSHQQADEGSRNRTGNARRDQDSGQCDQSRRDSVRVEIRQMRERFEQVQVELLVRSKTGQAEKIVDLSGKDNDGDTGSETRRHRVGYESNQGAGSEHPHHNEHESGNQPGKQQVVQPILDEDDGQDCDHRAGRSADLNTRAAEYRDRRSRDDRRIEPAIRRNTARDREGHGEWNRHNAHDDSGEHIFPKPLGIVAFHPAVETKTQFCCSLSHCSAHRKANGCPVWLFKHKGIRAAHFPLSGFSESHEASVFPSWNRRGGCAIKKKTASFEGADGEGVNELAGERLNSPPKLGGVPARPSSSTKGRAGGVVPKQVVARFYLGTTPSAPALVASRHFINGAATPPNLGGELSPLPIHSHLRDGSHTRCFKTPFTIT